MRRTEEELRRRGAVLDAVRFAADQFLGEAIGWEQSVSAVLRRLGEATEASRVYVFENYAGEDGELWATQCYEWVARGVSVQLGNPLLKALPYKAAGFGRWVELLGRGDLVHGHVRDLPEDEQPELRYEEILSIAIVPIFVEGRWWGFIGFDECAAEREWSAAEVSALGAAAGTLGAAIRRRQVDERLRQSEERYRAVVEQATDGIFLLDVETRKILEANPAFCRMFGYNVEELGAVRIYDLVAHPREDVDAAIRRTLAQRRRLVGERKYRRKDGELLDVDIGASVISYGGGEAICTIVRDITERKQAEQALKQSEELYRTVIEQATENIFLVDVETRRIVESNAAFRSALGYSEEELHRMKLYGIVAAGRESVDENIRRVLSQSDLSVGERKYRRKDGSLLQVEVSASIILRDGRETICAVAHDITERARAQRLLEERLSALSRLGARLTLEAPVQDTLDAMTQSIVNASTAVACSVALSDDATGSLRIKGSYGLTEEFVSGIEAVWREGTVRSPTMEAVRALRPTLASHMRQRMLESTLYAPVHDSIREVEWDTVFIVPLVSRGRSMGAINFAYLPGQEPGEDERTFLTAVADQAAIAIENSRLLAEARGKAALEERQRLARELHDSVSQALYGIALGTKTARAMLGREPVQLEEPLDYVLSLTEAGLAEMRALIFELRPESLEEEGLTAALEKQAAAVHARHRIEVQANLCEEPEATPEIKETIYRITQEALHNTVKHARASRAAVEMQCSPGSIEIEISDDGAGFDPSEEFPGHLGLRSMRERVSRLGGTLEIESAPETGTRIRASLPC